MARYRMVCLALVALAPATLAHADDCAGATDQRSMSACAGRAFQASDAALNAAYNQIQQRLKSEPDTAKLLVVAQRNWLAFRDAECRFSSSLSLGGTVYPMVYSGCLDALTKKRLGEFNAYLKCQEGDLSCPVPAR